MTHQQKIWAQELNLCVSSAEGFRIHLPNIRSFLYYRELQYRNFFFDHISLIITSKDSLPSSRFFSLYLLFRISENAGSLFINQLAECNYLLEFICRAAQHESIKKLAFDERGRFYFSKEPTVEESITGINFVRLCFESIIFWGEAFGEEDSKHPCYSFILYSNTLRKKFKVSNYHYFINRNYDLSEDLSVWNFYDRLPKMIETPKESPSRRLKGSTIVAQNVSAEHSEASEDAFKVEGSSKTDSEVRSEEDQQFSAFLRKVTKRNYKASDNTGVSQLEVVSKSNKPKSQDLLKELAFEKIQSQTKEKPENSTIIRKESSPLIESSLEVPRRQITKEKSSDNEDITCKKLEENKIIVDNKRNQVESKPLMKDKSYPIKGKSSSLTSLSTIIKLNRLASAEGDTRLSISKQYREDKIVSDLREIQKLIKKSNVKLTKPLPTSLSELLNQEKDTERKPIRFSPRSSNMIDGDLGKAQLGGDQTPLSNRSIEAMSPKFFTGEESTQKKKVRSSDRIVTFGPQQEANTGSHSSIWAEREEVRFERQQEIREVKIKSLLLEYSVKQKKVNDPFSIYSHAKPVSLNTIYEDKLVQPVKLANMDSYNQDVGLQRKNQMLTVKTDGYIWNGNHAKKSNDNIGTADTIESKGVDNFLAYSFAPNFNITEDNKSSLLSSPTWAMRKKQEIETEVWETISVD